MKIEELKTGEAVQYTGPLLIMRDAAQKRIIQETSVVGSSPIELKGRIIFYAGPAKAPEGYPFGAVGPTTSSRMDKTLEFLYQHGAIATIGKGKRSPLATELCRRYRRVYFVAPSGAAAALMTKIVKASCLAYPDLGTEAVYSVEVVDLPLITAIDANGEDIFSRLGKGCDGGLSERSKDV